MCPLEYQKGEIPHALVMTLLCNATEEKLELLRERPLECHPDESLRVIVNSQLCSAMVERQGLPPLERPQANRSLGNALSVSGKRKTLFETGSQASIQDQARHTILDLCKRYDQ